MPDPMTVGSALGAAKAAFDLTKAFVDVRDATKAQEVKFELMRLLIQAQETEVALVAEKRDLEERVRKLETWEREKERYLLEEVGLGGFAYAIRPEAQGSEPKHYLCAYCYEQRKKSPLMTVYIPQGRAEMLKCQPCGAEIVTSGVDLRPSPTTGFRGHRPLAG